MKKGQRAEKMTIIMHKREKKTTKIKTTKIKTTKKK